MTDRMIEIDQTSQIDPKKHIKDESAWLKQSQSEKLPEQNSDKEIEVRQRVFNHSPEFKKREIVFSQIQRIQTRLSILESKVDQILEILKSSSHIKSS